LPTFFKHKKRSKNKKNVENVTKIKNVFTSVGDGDCEVTIGEAVSAQVEKMQSSRLGLGHEDKFLWR